MQSIYENQFLRNHVFKLVHDKPEKQATHNWTVTVLSHGANKLHQTSLALQPVLQSCCQLSWENQSWTNPAPAGQPRTAALFFLLLLEQISYSQVLLYSNLAFHQPLTTKRNSSCCWNFWLRVRGFFVCHFSGCLWRVLVLSKHHRKQKEAEIMNFTFEKSQFLKQNVLPFEEAG